MKLRLDTLPEHLHKTLAPVYYLSGDEPFQLGQACDLIRRAAQQQGYSERQVFHAERGFDWQRLTQASDNLSLFAERKVIDLRLGAGKLNAEASAVLQRYLARPPADTVLLISGDKVEAAQQKSAWFSAIDTIGVILQVWPIETARLPAWITQRLRQRELHASPDAVQFLADQVEGNLLAADQEIEKLSLLYGTGALTLEQMQSAVADSARFDIFGLVDEAMRGQPARATRMLYGLQAEGMDPILILWALAREIRALALMAEQLARGSSVDQAMAQQHVWDKRKPLVRQALQRGKLPVWRRLLARCAQADRLIKGMGAGKIWNELLELTVAVAGKPSLKNAG
jgi:DNA polymerase-3 subunit delta